MASLSSKEGMLKLIEERAVFVGAEKIIGVYNKWYGAELALVVVYFRKLGGIGTSWIITYELDHKTGDRKLISYFFKVKKQRWKRMPDSVTQALILKAWPQWTPD